jgi:hypothetical protein
MVPTL